MSKITETLNIIDFPDDASEFFEEVYEKIRNDNELISLLSSLESLYLEKFSCDELEMGLKTLSEKSGYHKYTIDMLLIICCAIKLRDIYAEKGYSDEFFAHNMKDLTYKAKECEKLHGFFGSQRLVWYDGFFKMERFALGRLQYERKEMLFDYGNIKKKGDEVINIHIPSSGPLKPDEVKESLKLAYDFFGPNLGEKLIFMCNTWMLYPKTASLYPKGSNLNAFYELFEIIEEREDTADSNKWRIFYVQTDDNRSLPRETSLQRSFYDYLNSGKHMGTGFGILVYSPDK